ncbi:MAG: hypothetical protein KDC87_13785 [Planctomycetes bacterium]|nr:hypothetical protein [Planctomycetota bacterium]MCB9889664.1 hypothetical protein [Planctomycetota bacterium]
MSEPDVPQEPWDLQRFARLYDAEAEQRHGCRFDPDDLPAEQLERLYHLGRYPSLAEFARRRFEYDAFYR